MKNCIRPHYEKLKPLKSGFIENSNFENNRDPWVVVKRKDGALGSDKIPIVKIPMIIIPTKVPKKSLLVF